MAEKGEYDVQNVGPQYRRGRLYSVDTSVPHIHAQMANTRLEYLSLLNVFAEPFVVRNTGIICTIGPKCNSVETLMKLIKNGMCIARFNFSHGTHESHAKDIANVRTAVSQVPGKLVAIALDTKGPEIRTGQLKGGVSVKLEIGKELKLTTDEEYRFCGDESCIYVDYKNIAKVVELHEKIYIDDGLISLKVIAKGPTPTDPTYIITVVQNEGWLGSRKGVNLPDTKVDLPALTDRDKKDIAFGIDHDVDMVFASFVRKAEDVAEIRKELGERGKHILIISKVENKEGVEKFDEILRASDGIMVARGDLGIEIPPEKVFLAQKMMIGRCNRAGKPVIVATQMLESMTDKPRSTRAEATDVANAVLDGADCVMLSGETANGKSLLIIESATLKMGKYPVEAVAFMSKVCLEAEAAMFHRVMFDDLRHLTPRPTVTIQTAAIAAVNASFQQDAAAIMTLTTTGRTAFELSKYRPRCPIIAITRDPRTARLCHLHRGIRPLLYTEPMDSDWAKDVDKCFHKAILKGKEEGYLESGSTIIEMSGWKPGPAHINTIRITQLE